MKSLTTVWLISAAIVFAGFLTACANDSVKETATNAKPINYGCSGTSINDCMRFHTPDSPTVKR